MNRSVCLEVTMNYKVTRIGLINFWYFDDEEFAFSDGKILLRGENGSGKSVTMQSFIPLILDGNKAPSRLDPFGSKEKRIEDYLLGPSDGMQKDDSTGYLYMEAYNQETDKYITVGMGLRARKGQGTDFWGFSLKDGKRIGEDFLLYKEYGQKILLSKKELKARLGTTNDFVETTKEYKSMVNDLLFGFKDLDAYDEFINVLLQLRSSKLSKEYTPTKLMSILSSVLQPLTEDDIRPISEAIEDSNKTREKIDTLQKQVKSLSNLLKSYQNYNEIILYHKALAVSEKTHDIKNKETGINKKEEQIAEGKRRLEEIKTQFDALEKEYSKNQARLETIDNKDLQKYTTELVTIKENIKRVNNSIKVIKDKLESIFSKEREIKIKIEKYNDKVYKDEKDLESIASDIIELSNEIKLIDITTTISKISQKDDINFDYLEERVEKYKTKLNQIKIKLEEKESLERDLNSVEEERIHERKKLEEKEKNLKVEEKKLGVLVDEFKDKINVLDKENQIIKLETDKKAKIFQLFDSYNQNNYLLAKEEYLNTAKYYETGILEDKNNISHKLAIEEKELSLLQEELINLKNKKELELDDDDDVINALNDKQIPFVSFYKAIEFQDNISDDDKNKLEELLNHMNILNAKIVSKKYLKSLTGINTIFLKAGKKKDNSLKKYFKVLDNEIVSKDEISDILDSISINQTDDVYLSTNSYQLDFIVGYPGKKYESKYIGVIKRLEEQKRKIKEKEEEIESKEKLIINYQNLLESAKKKLETIQLETKLFPDNQELEECQRTIHDIELSIQIMIEKDKELIDKITTHTKQIELKIVEINNLKENILIPLNLASYKEALAVVEKITKNIYGLKNTYQSWKLNREQKETNEFSLEDVKESLEYQNEELSDKNKELDVLESKEKTINEVLSNPDYQKVIEELKSLTERQNKIPDEKLNLNSEISQLQTQLSIMETSLVDDKGQFEKDKAELELRSFILENEYNLHYIYKEEESLDVNKILSDLKERKNSYVNRALDNYHQAYNDYRLELLEYRLNTKEIFGINEDLLARYVEKGLDASFVESLIDSATRQDMSAVYQGKVLNIYILEDCLKQAIVESESYINQQERHLFEDILLKTVGNKIRDKIESSKQWVAKMNDIMKNTQIDSNLSFQLEWKSKAAFTEDELDTKELVRLFKIDAGQLKKEDSEKLITHFRSQIKKELEYSEKSHESYTSIISKVLDYRNWFEFKLYYQRKSGEKRELTNKVFFVLSGGERAKSMYVPLFASVYAKLLTARQSALRLIALDEAFAGVDNSNVREMFAILSQLNLDYILTSQALWCDYDSIKSISICQLIKDEIHKAVAVRHYHWNGQAIELLEKFGDNDIYE